MFTTDMLVAHLVGDYLFQSDWMAQVKVKASWPAFWHAVTYTLPFLFLTTSWKALLFIAGTHFLIDRFRLARYVCWAKNFLAPKWIEAVVDQRMIRHPVTGKTCGMSELGMVRNYPWPECEGTGYHKDRPAWLAVWLLIITDNTLHLLCNGIALRWL